MKYITLSVKLRNPQGKLVNGEIIIRDGFALAVFSDEKLAYQLYEMDKKQGADVAYNEKRNAYIQRFKGMKKDQILEKIKNEIESSGGKCQQ